MTPLRLTGLIGLHLIVIVGALLMFFPFLWTIVTSITPGANLGVTPDLIPKNPSLEAYVRLFTERPFGRVIFNSVLLATITTAIQLFTSSTAGYAFSRLPFRGQTAVFAVYLATMMIPLQVLIVPLFVELKTFGLLNTYLGALLPTFASAFGIFLLRQAINQVPRELDEAATIDGAGHFRIFFSVILPNIRPALATLVVFAFMGSWNSFLWPLLIVSDVNMATVPLGLNMFLGQTGNQWNLLMAASTISVIPSALIVILLQRYLVSGIALSGMGGR